MSDTVAFGAGIKLGTDFGPGFSGPTTVAENTLNRAGSYNSNWGSALGAIWVYASNHDITHVDDGRPRWCAVPGPPARRTARGLHAPNTSGSVASSS